MEKFLYFQPQYVGEFQCDGAKCNARCCKNWNVFIDKETYEQYSDVKPEADAREILSHMKFRFDRDEYLVTMDERKFCPFLTEKNLCRLQLTYGEKFLSVTCTTYPRRTFHFGKFFEQSLALTCPVAAEKILFNEEPMQFELVPVSEEKHLRGGKLGFAKVDVAENFGERMLETQVAMISILQERTLSIDERLIVLGFFLDRLDEIISDGLTVDALEKLIAAYESKSFLSEQFPRMSAVVHFDAKKFWGTMLILFEKLYGNGVESGGKKFMDALVETLNIRPDRDGKISAARIVANYERLADARKKFLARRSNFLENFLVNELFTNCYPWRHEATVAKNFGVFVAQYKIFELLMFSAAQKNLDGGDDLLRLVDWFVTQADHENSFTQKILELAPEDIFSSLETFCG